MSHELLEVFHIIAVISWMAGLLYLPRIFVYHCQVEKGGEADKIFQVMERKLLKYIMLPSMIFVFVLGFSLANNIGFENGWLHAKMFLALCLAGYQGFLSRCRKNFAAGVNNRSEKFFRMINEVPIIVAFFIVYLVVFQPF